MGRISILTRRDFFKDARARVAVSRTPRQDSIGQHRHEFFEIAIVLSGEAVHVTGAFRHRIGVGEVLFLDPRRAHGYEETRGLNLLNILIRDDALARIGRELGGRAGYHALFSLEPDREKGGFRRRLRLSPRELEQIEEWASRIEEAAPARGAARLLGEAYLTLIVDILSRKYGRGEARSEGQALPGAALPGAPVRVRLGRLLSWIEARLAEPLRVPELALRVGMSERTFRRAFRSATGLSPLAYVIRARLSRAAQRLAATAPGEESIGEIALACGFEDGNHFASAFHRFAGMSPTAWRKKALSRPAPTRKR